MSRLFLFFRYFAVRFISLLPQDLVKAVDRNYFRRTITASSQAMSLLARAPRLAARSARSNVLVQPRGMHGEYRVRLFRGVLRSPCGQFTNM